MASATRAPLRSRTNPGLRTAPVTDTTMIAGLTAPVDPPSVGATGFAPVAAPDETSCRPPAPSAVPAEVFATAVLRAEDPIAEVPIAEVPVDAPPDSWASETDCTGLGSGRSHHTP